MQVRSWFVFCVTLVAVFLQSSFVLARDSERPHIVFVYFDDMGPGDLGCYGGRVAATPEIDRLAAEGTRFTQYYSVSPICSPSRCGVLTGQFPARWKITSYLQDRKGNRACEQADFLAAEAPSLPRVLQSAGYATAHVGKWHLGGGRDVDNAPKFAAYGYDRGIGTWESPEPHPEITATNWIWSDRDPVKRWNRTAFFVDQTLEFFKRYAEQPCFVNLWLDDPHTPWVPETAAKIGKGQPQELLKQVLEENDRQIGRLKRNLPPNTLLIVAVDNGPLPTFQAARTLGLRGSKLSLYEGGIRLPFIAWWPKQVPAGRVDETTLLAAVDLFPTLAAIAGAKLPDVYRGDGEDLSAAFRGKAVARQGLLYWEYGRNEQSFAYPAGRDRSPKLAVREGNWKLLMQPDAGGAELYDLARDPKETENLREQHPEVTERLSRQLTAWWKGLPQIAK